MAHFVFNYTSAPKGDRRPLREQAADLLRVGLWGLPESAERRRRPPQAGDEIVALAGGSQPERAFVGRAVLSSGIHHWSAEEWERYRASGKLPSGVAFGDSHPWRRPLPLVDVWPRLEAARTNQDAHIQGAVFSLSEDDYLTVLEAAGEPRVPEADETWEEGTAVHRRHRAHERNRGAVAEKKAQVRAANGRLVCEGCETDGEDLYGVSAEAAFECHHRLPLTEGPRVTKAADLALLCASCHRVLHAVEPLPSVEQLRARLGCRP